MKMAPRKAAPSPRAGRARVAGLVVVGALSLAFVAAPSGEVRAERIKNGQFLEGLQGWDAPSAAVVEDGRGCLPGALWGEDQSLSQQVTLEGGQTYELSLVATMDPPGPMKVRLEDSPGAGHTSFIEPVIVPVGYDRRELRFTVTPGAASSDPKIHLLQDSGPSESGTLCVDDVSLLPVQPANASGQSGSPVRVNQVGYLSGGPKHATVVTDAVEPKTWKLVDSAGDMLATGATVPRGLDPSANMSVQTIDFTSAAEGIDGTEMRLQVDDAVSAPFDIRDDLYSGLARDSMAFFYANRSGVEIADAVLPGYGRRAGHVGIDPNRGDVSVSCLPESDPGQQLYDSPWTCGATFDVSGGWYDAGDQGKYMVSAAVAVAQMMMAFERDPTRYADGSLAVPVDSRDAPDALDEARWELEWMQRMQVPTGNEYGGMAFHKVANVDWQPLAVDPADDDLLRVLHRPSTAATLSLAAATAQGARVFRPYDERFADSLLQTARSAYDAAIETPDLMAPAEDPQVDPNPGSGAFDDSEMTDEFYWAAIELYLATGELHYKSAVSNSPHHASGSEDEETRIFPDRGFGWGEVAALGRLELATAPSEFPEREAATRSVVAAADRYLDQQQHTMFGQPYMIPQGGYEWGSNSQVLNNVQVLGTAYDLTGDRAYGDAAVQGLDYVLGRNALNRSYVTGYGERYSRNQHSHLYAHDIDPTLPEPPAGTMAGGANSLAALFGDPAAIDQLQDCVEQTCYVDDVESYATNEIAINWNSSLVWVAGFAAGYADCR